MFDESRKTFDRRKHYGSVRMQQGRVQLDADWNEQAEIAAYRVEIEAVDALGRSGAPLHAAGFRVVLGAADPLTDAEKGTGGLKELGKGDLAVTAGRYWVDGTLCENEAVVAFTGQPDRRGVAPLQAQGDYLVYLDVWRRGITYLDDADLREVALGGPDTTGRLRTVWQVRATPSKGSSCAAAFGAIEDAEQERQTGQMRARARAEVAHDECLVPPSAGYRGLENQLYRVEVHREGASRLATSASDETIVTRSPESDHEVVVARGTWTVDQEVELYATGDPLGGTLFRVRAVRDKTLTLDAPVGGAANAALRLRPVGATFKWAIDNATTVTKVKRVDQNDPRKLEVERVEFDDARAFARNLWVELIDDARELEGAPGALFRIVRVDTAKKTIEVDANVTALDPAQNPKLRLWHGVVGVKHVASPRLDDGWIGIDKGVQIRFTEGNYRTANYWTIPARAATSDAQGGRVLWPTVDPDRPPDGIQHHHAPLALVRRTAETLELVSDCRKVFPPLAELVSLFYLGGDGQEAAPDILHPDALVELPVRLEVGVAKGEWPVEGATVKFSITRGKGELVPDTGTASSSDVTVRTSAKGVASCRWRLRAPAAGEVDGNPYQVTAQLVVDGTVKHLPITFTANTVRTQGGCSEQAARTPAELRQVLLAIPERGHAHVCLPPGELALDAPIWVKGKGELKITGSGPGTRISSAAEAALVFEDCDGVTVRDVLVNSNGAAGGKAQLGALTFRDCGRVTVEDVALGVAAGPLRAAACLTARGVARSTSLRVRSCDFTVGDGQVGILVTGTDRCEIHDNRLVGGGKPRPFRTKLEDGRFRAGVNSYLMFPTLVDVGAGGAPALKRVPAEFVTRLSVRIPRGFPEGLVVRQHETVERNGHVITYEAPADLVPSWQRLFKAHPTVGLRDMGYGVIAEYLAGVPAGKFIDDAFRKALDLLSQENDTVGAQGIVVGGSIEQEIRIVDNTVRGFTQGIHVGQSVGPRAGRSERTLIAGNTVQLRLLGSHWYDRQGVFTGNAESTVIENNLVKVERSTLALGLPVEGYRVIGVFGALLVVRQNHADDCNVGFRVRAINAPRLPPPNPTYMWRVVDNAARGTFTPFDVVPPMP